MPDQPFFETFFDLLAAARDNVEAARLLGSEEYKFLTFAADFLLLSQAQLLQDLWVLYELGGKRGGWFVEIGAADGRYLSNTFALETYFGWQGALCEPNPAWHRALATNRSAFISHCALAGAARGPVRFNAAPAPEYSTIAGYGDADRHAEARRGGRIVAVESLGLGDFLAAAAAPRQIDYLSIDTEGSEYEILSGFDFGRWEIRLLTVEHNHTENRERLWRLLTQAGYRRKFERFSQWDDWYVLAR